MDLPQHVPREALWGGDKVQRRRTARDAALLRGAPQCQRHVVRGAQQQRHPRPQRVSTRNVAQRGGWDGGHAPMVCVCKRGGGGG